MANEFIRELEQEQPNLTSFGSCAGSLVESALIEVQRIIRAHRGNVQHAISYALAEMLERELITDTDHGDLMAIYADIHAVIRGHQSLHKTIEAVQKAHENMHQRKGSTPIARMLADLGRAQITGVGDAAASHDNDGDLVVRKVSVGHQILAAAAVGALFGSAWGGTGAVVGAFVGPLAGALVGACSGDNES